MNILALVFTLTVIGVLLGLLNHFGPLIWIDSAILQVINVIVVLCVVVWLLDVLNVLGYLRSVRVPWAR